MMIYPLTLYTSWVSVMSQTEQVIVACLIVLVVLGLIAFVMALITPRRLRISYFEIKPGQALDSNRVEYDANPHAIKNLPAKNPAAATRLVFFSDYHAGLNRIPISVFINSLLSAKPELVLFGGDLATNHRDKEKALQHIELISAALLTEGIPFYAVWGNHDTVLSPEDLASRSITMLRNQSTIFQAESGEDWLIVGLDDQRTGQPNWQLARSQIVPKDRQLKLKNRIDEIPKERTLVLAHNPDTSLDLPESSLSLAFSGHYHGGQINLPFRLGYRTLRNDQAWRQGYLQGLYPHKDYLFFISRGVGSVQFPLRLFSYPELSVFDIYTEK